ncbi:HEPN domain-containing protein [Candidatus Woesearchaeota archaeon]|nr:HEPN domain-containing protein [Candidatus Woesearchaeota archaeon]
MNLKECIDNGYLVLESRDNALIQKEFQESEHDFTRAQKLFQDKDYKWTIVTCYYSVFHAAKAVCFACGYREKKHIALLILLQDLNKQGKLEREFTTSFHAAIDSRESADYQYTYSKEIAEHNLKIAERFNKRMRELVEKL